MVLHMWLLVLPVVLVLSALRLSSAATGAVGGLTFNSVFAPGMLLQRGGSTKIWGYGAIPNGTVRISIDGLTSAGVSVATPTGDWQVTLPTLVETNSTSLHAADGHTTAVLTDVAIGELLLCGGQSNMGYGMCGALSVEQTPAEAMATLAPVRYLFVHGSGPGGGSGTGKAESNCNGVHYITPNGTWFRPDGRANNNTGGASAICMLTASALHKHLGGRVPVGAIESCQSATNVQPWTPAAPGRPTSEDGPLFAQWIRPLLPMKFRAVLWYSSKFVLPWSPNLPLFVLSTRLSEIPC